MHKYYYQINKKWYYYVNDSYYTIKTEPFLVKSECIFVISNKGTFHIIKNKQKNNAPNIDDALLIALSAEPLL